MPLSDVLHARLAAAVLHELRYAWHKAINEKQQLQVRLPMQVVSVS